MPETPVVERAFQLARTGNNPRIDDIRRQLSREGYASADLGISGPVLQKQLRALITYLATLKPKARLRYLKAVSDIIGDPAVVPLLPVQRVKVIQETRELWARIVPNHDQRRGTLIMAATVHTTRTTRRRLITAGAALSAVPTVSTASSADARFLVWEREAIFWREASNDPSPKTDVELDVILDRYHHFEDLIMTTPGHGATVARIRARLALRDVRDFGPAHLEAPPAAVLTALNGRAV